MITVPCSLSTVPHLSTFFKIPVFAVSLSDLITSVSLYIVSTVTSLSKVLELRSELFVVLVYTTKVYVVSGSKLSGFIASIIDLSHTLNGNSFLFDSKNEVSKYFSPSAVTTPLLVFMFSSTSSAVSS